MISFLIINCLEQFIFNLRWQRKLHCCGWIPFKIYNCDVQSILPDECSPPILREQEQKKSINHKQQTRFLSICH